MCLDSVLFLSFEVYSLYVAETSLLSCGNSPASAFQMLGFLVRPITRGFKISFPFNDWLKGRYRRRGRKRSILTHIVKNGYDLPIQNFLFLPSFLLSQPAWPESHLWHLLLADLTPFCSTLATSDTLLRFLSFCLVLFSSFLTILCWSLRDYSLPDYHCQRF